VIYIHIPFCRSFCTYCDFYSEVAARCRKAEEAQEQEAMFGRFAEALVSEIGLHADEITDETNTLYIGGGTPSVLPLCVYERILDALKEAGHGGPYEEFTVEVNPEDIVDKGEAYVKGLLALGVNRISMGVQSFDDGILKFMNRRHDSKTARRAYAILEAAGVENISIDLIFGLPQLSDAQWQETLDQALSISGSGALPKHISSYQLSVEPGSMLAKLVERGKWEEASEDLCQRQYGMLCDALQKAGYRHYEISNFALEGYEAKHNSAYWRHVPYVGFGPGAHSFVGMRRQWNEPDLKKYIEDPAGCREGEELTDEQMVIERIMLALRTSEGISEAYLREHCDQHELSRALAAGNLESVENGMLRIPESRFFISDSIIASLI
jgi:oxygen-independent coproporphyrinogen-3 oxidase